jgi:hypothetical protein
MWRLRLVAEKSPAQSRADNDQQGQAPEKSKHWKERIYYATPHLSEIDIFQCTDLAAYGV